MTKVLIYTTQYCPFCFRAKDLLENKDIPYQEITIDNSSTLRQEMINLSGRTSVPQIFINDKSIGGCDDLIALDQSGQLEELLNLDPEI